MADGPVSVQIVGLPELQALWARAPELVAEQLAGATRRAQLLLVREIQERTPTGVTGLLRQGTIAERPLRLADQVIGVVSNPAPHAVPVELGTRPHWAPIEPLKDWVRQTWDLRTEAEVESAAINLQRKIAARGTPAIGMFHRAFTACRPQIEAMYARAQRRIVKQLAGEGGGEA